MPMIASKLNRLWRIFGTGLAFVLFGVGAVFISVTMFPVLRLISWGPEAARRRIQNGMQFVFRTFVGIMKGLGLLTCEVHGVERLRQQGRLIIANHPTLVDVVFLVSLMPQVDCIVKSGLWRNPFLRWPVAWASYIPNSSGEGLVEDCAASLRRGHSLLVFPEGTRSVPGQPMQMQRGAAHVALASGADILPITIRCTHPFLTKGFPWYRAPPVRPHFIITVGEPIAASHYNARVEPAALAARRLTQWFADYYADAEAERLSYGRPAPSAPDAGAVPVMAPAQRSA